MVDLSVIIVNWNTRELVTRCVQHVYDTVQSLSLEVIVVDNASTDDSVTAIRGMYPQVKIIQNCENVGFARANNQAAAASTGRYLLLVNSDAWLQTGAARALYDLAESQCRAGIVGACLLNPDQSFQASHTPFPTLEQEFLILSGLGRKLYGRWYPSHGPDQVTRIVDYVEGACLLVRREALDQVGGMDEGYFMYAEEVDWCYAMQKSGWQVWYQPAARVIHLGGASSQHRRPEQEGNLYRSRVRFFRKNYGNRAAQLLAAQLIVFTAIKQLVHGGLRLASGGRRGRQVVSLKQLLAELRTT